MALVVRQRGGPNLVVHTRGIPGGLVNRACEEAVTIMGRFALGRGQTDVDGSGDIHPKFAHDKLLVLNGRYAVVYRLVFKVWVMAVTTARSSALVSVRLVEAATKGLVTTCQVLEVDNDVVARNYPEVHFMMGAVLKYQGADLQKAQAEALANIYSYIADTREKKGRASTDSTKKIPSVRTGSRKLSDFNGANQKFDFQLPNDFKRLLNPSALPSPSTFTSDFGTAAEPKPSIKTLPTFDLDDLIFGQSTSEPRSSTTQQPVTIDDIFKDTATTAAPVKQESIDPFVTVPALPAISTATQEQSSNWWDFGSDQRQPVAAFQSPVVQMTAQAPVPLLYLMEKWEGSFEGSRCTKSEAWGEVGLRKQIWKNSAGKELKFKLAAASGADNLAKPVMSLMKCVKLNMARTSISDSGVFSARVKAAPAPYLKYRFLPGTVGMPIRLSVVSAMVPFKEYQRCMIWRRMRTMLLQLTEISLHGYLDSWESRSLHGPRPS